MYNKLMRYVRAYTFDFCSFISVVYTALNKLLVVFCVYNIWVLLKNL